MGRVVSCPTCTQLTYVSGKAAAGEIARCLKCGARFPIFREVSDDRAAWDAAVPFGLSQAPPPQQVSRPSQTERDDPPHPRQPNPQQQSHRRTGRAEASPAHAEPQPKRSGRAASGQQPPRARGRVRHDDVCAACGQSFHVSELTERDGSTYCLACLMQHAAQTSLRDKLDEARRGPVSAGAASSFPSSSPAPRASLSRRRLNQLVFGGIPCVAAVVLLVMWLMNAPTSFERRWGDWVVQQKRTADEMVATAGDVSEAVVALEYRPDPGKARELRQRLQEARAIYQGITDRAAGQYVRNVDLAAAVEQASVSERQLALLIARLSRLPARPAVLVDTTGQPPAAPQQPPAPTPAQEASVQATPAVPAVPVQP